MFINSEAFGVRRHLGCAVLSEGMVPSGPGEGRRQEGCQYTIRTRHCNTHVVTQTKHTRMEKQMKVTERAS